MELGRCRSCVRLRAPPGPQRLYMSKYLVFCVATVGTGRGLSPVAGKVTAASRNQIWWTRGTGLGLVTADAMMYCNGEEAQSAVRSGKIL